MEASLATKGSSLLGLKAAGGHFHQDHKKGLKTIPITVPITDWVNYSPNLGPGAQYLTCKPFKAPNPQCRQYNVSKMSLGSFLVLKLPCSGVKGEIRCLRSVVGNLQPVGFRMRPGNILFTAVHAQEWQISPKYS